MEVYIRPHPSPARSRSSHLLITSPDRQRSVRLVWLNLTEGRCCVHFSNTVRNKAKQTPPHTTIKWRSTASHTPPPAGPSCHTCSPHYWQCGVPLVWLNLTEGRCCVHFSNTSRNKAKPPPHTHNIHPVSTAAHTSPLPGPDRLTCSSHLRQRGVHSVWLNWTFWEALCSFFQHSSK